MKIEMETPNDEEMLNNLQISSLDHDEDEDEGAATEDDVSDDSDEEEEEEEEEEQIAMTLGFAEKPKNKWSLLPQYFPSKAGGTPAWLDPVNLPSEKSSCCGFCGEPMQFLLQVYAPLSEESTFHRTLFVFMCRSMACLLRDQHEQWKRQSGTLCRSVKVLRCQLPRVNSFYSPESPADDGSAQPLIPGALLCNWCGTWKGDKICSSCKRARYCSARHQTAHWKSTNASHKRYCRQLEALGETSVSVASNCQWPEYEIINDDECELGDSETTKNNESANSLISRNQVNDSFAENQTYFEGRDDTRSFATFQERISLAPEQILRYSTSAQAKPLWPMFSGRPSKPDIPKCNHCGGSRAFEFQILPQLLYFFHVKDTEDSLDWSTIVVYTCEASCGGGMGYKEEFAFIQLPSQQRRAPGIVS